MRALLTLAALLIVTANVPAQTPPPGKLDSYLDSWEKRMADVKTMSAVLTRLDTDQVFKSSTKYTGWAAYMKSGAGVTALNKAILELKPEGKTEVSEKVVCTGTYAYVYVPGKKEIQAHEMPRGRAGDVADNASLGLMFGMKAAAAKERFTLSLFKEDANYIYVDVEPRKAEDRVEFSKARLILDRSTFLPRQVWLKQPNGSEVLWDMPRVGTGIALNQKIFDTPTPEPGWKIVPVTKDAPGVKPQPRVIRPASP